MSDPAIDRAYNVRNTVDPSVFESTLTAYRTLSDAATTGLPGATGITYDRTSGQRLDIWGTAPGELRPLFLVVHGGYWRMLSRQDTAFMARSLEGAGVATVAIDYGLAPETAIEEIIRQVRSSVAWVYRHGAEYGLDPQRIIVGGSSAGGHLAASVLVRGWQAEFGLPDDVVAGGLPISGLFDLRPLVDSFANEWLRLDEQRAAAASPMLVAEQPGPPVVVAVAEHDGTGFIAQSHEFHTRWAAHSASELLVVPGRHHYDVFLDLADPDSALTTALLGLAKPAR